MTYYYVYVNTPGGWEPIKEFAGNGAFVTFDSRERLSYEQAMERRNTLAAKYLHLHFKVDVFN